MPRGNIETIYPRALVVAAVRRFLDQHKYGSAIEVCRKHMVDMNILHDYDPVMFKSNVPKFVTQLKPIDMDEFLMRLKYGILCLLLI
jgi:elongator complex protein 1